MAGEEKKVIRANSEFMGVYLEEKGDYNVLFIYYLQKAAIYNKKEQATTILRLSCRDNVSPLEPDMTTRQEYPKQVSN